MILTSHVVGLCQRNRMQTVFSFSEAASRSRMERTELKDEEYIPAKMSAHALAESCKDHVTTFPTNVKKNATDLSRRAASSSLSLLSDSVAVLVLCIKMRRK